MLGESPSEMQAGSVLEGAVIALAAARVTRQGLDRVRACLDAMRNDIRRGNPPLEADRRFHVTIAELTGNTLLVRLVAELLELRDPQEAAAAMCGHLKASRERWIEQSGSTPDSDS